MIKPTIGRVVWFYPFGAKADSQPFAAVVTYVHSDRLINVAGWNANGDHFAHTSLTLLQEGDPTLFTAGPDHVASKAHAQWMPFQKGQAAKTEAAEARLTNGDPPRGGMPVGGQSL